jgi:hypothetical protein
VRWPERTANLDQEVHMNITSKLAATTVGLTLALTPAAALAHGHPSTGMKPTQTAYGRLCQSESKLHVAGEKGTPFSQCVTALAHVAKTPTMNAHKACATESKKHVVGQKGTPFSQCIVAANRLRQEQKKNASGSTSGS